MPKKRFLKKAVLAAIILIASLSLLYVVFMPDVSKLKTENPKKTAFMEYREREWAEKGRRHKITQIWAPLSGISPYLIKAVLIAEDDKFYKHEGFDYEALQKAIEKDIKAKKFKFGGSTISQQLAKNLYLSPSKNPLRKAAEAVITFRMEQALTKKRILELYLNVVEWGEGIFGIEAAARNYFGKSASALTAEEAARLSAVLPNPRKYNPAGDQRYVVNRSNLIYSVMVRRGIVVPEYKEVTGGIESSEGEGSAYVPVEKPKLAD
jgi:monofunctional biosynthetic peptidoglycan transglycosylase